MRFHHVVTRPDLARFEDRSTRDAWRDATARFASGVAAPHFEDVAREFVAKFAGARTTGGPISRVGGAVPNDPAGRAQHQIDVVGLGAGERHPTVRVIGEAKYARAPVGITELHRLDRIRDLLRARRDVRAQDTRLAIFSASGFDDRLRQAAATRDDVELIDLSRIYHGR